VSKRYPMTNDQHAQIDCRRVDCVYNSGGGNCTNVSPAITLGADGKATCWSSYTLEEEDVSDKMTFEAVARIPEAFNTTDTLRLRAIDGGTSFTREIHGARYRVTLDRLLKPCPFCGGEAEPLEEPYVLGGVTWHVKCRKCSVATEKQWTRGDACAAWNRRAKEAP
jgi:Lar family restriction alleviation protein